MSLLLKGFFQLTRSSDLVCEEPGDNERYDLVLFKLNRSELNWISQQKERGRSDMSRANTYTAAFTVEVIQNSDAPLACFSLCSETQTFSGLGPGLSPGLSCTVSRQHITPPSPSYIHIWMHRKTEPSKKIYFISLTKNLTLWLLKFSPHNDFFSGPLGRSWWGNTDNEEPGADWNAAIDSFDFSFSPCDISKCLLSERPSVWTVSPV